MRENAYGAFANLGSALAPLGSVRLGGSAVFSPAGAPSIR